MTDKMKNRTVTTGCGQGTVFGDLMADIDKVKLPAAVRLSEATLYGMLDWCANMKRSTRRPAPCMAARCSTGPTCCISSRMSAATTRSTRSPARCGSTASAADKIFYTTGRLTSEMVIKAAQMGIPFLVSRSGLTQMGHEIAQKIGITMSAALPAGITCCSPASSAFKPVHPTASA